MNIIDQIKAEIERLKKQLVRGACAAQVQMETTCKEEAYNNVLSFLDTLKEQPVEIDIRKELASIEFMGVNDARDSETIARHFYELGRQSKPNGLSDEDEKTRKELIGQVIYIIPDNSECDNEGNVLPDYEKRIDKYIDFLNRISKPKVSEALEEEFQAYCGDFKDPETGEELPEDKCSMDMEQARKLARHFAQWGAEHAKKGEIPISADLEEASDGYAEKHGFRVPYDGSDNFYDDVDVKASKEGFIAGAKWGAEHSGSSEIPNDLEEAAKSHRSTANYGGDINLAMEDSYKKGAKWQKEQMMKEAVEGEVLDLGINYLDLSLFDAEKLGLAQGDEVKFIIVKED